MPNIKFSIISIYLPLTKTLSTILVHETNMVERFVYFESKMFKYAKVRHQKIKRISFVVVVTVRKLRPYFQG